jgi:hypothetical protein
VKTNATGFYAPNGFLTIRHLDCGRIQTVQPITRPNGEWIGWGSDADFCLACENEDKPAGLAYEALPAKETA